MSMIIITFIEICEDLIKAANGAYAAYEKRLNPAREEENARKREIEKKQLSLKNGGIGEVKKTKRTKIERERIAETERKFSRGWGGNERDAEGMPTEIAGNQNKKKSYWDTRKSIIREKEKNKWPRDCESDFKFHQELLINNKKTIPLK